MSLSSKQFLKVWRRSAAACSVRRTALLCLALGLALCAACATSSGRLPKGAIPPVVAVSEFENRSGFSGQWQLGTGMADLLVSELMHSKSYVVVERQHFDGLLAEFNRQKDKLFRPEGKLSSGQMKNAQFMIRGVINDFSQTGGGSLSVALRNIFLFGHGYEARVALTLTIVDIETGEIVSSIQSTGTMWAREAYAEATYKGVHFGGDAFFETPLGEATRDAIRQGVGLVTREMPRNFWRPMIAAIIERQIVLNGGADRGFREGEEFLVRAAAQPVTDPATGDVLSFLPGAKLGRLRVVRVEKKVSYAEAVGGGRFDRGQWLVKESESQP